MNYHSMSLFTMSMAGLQYSKHEITSHSTNIDMINFTIHVRPIDLLLTCISDNAKIIFLDRLLLRRRYQAYASEALPS